VTSGKTATTSDWRERRGSACLAPGAKLTATALYELRRRGGKRAVVTMCIGGGMGAAGLFEAID